MKDRNEGIFMNPRVTNILSGMALLACLLPHTVVQAQPDPVEVLQGMSDKVIAIVDEDPDILNDQARLREVADAIVVQNVDFVLFSKWVLGKNWRKATPEQREIFIAEFTELMISSYLATFTSEDYKNQVVHYKPVRKTNNPKRVMVLTEVEQSNGPLLDIRFRLHLDDTGWKVYDVIIEGVSMVATQRSSISDIIRRKGIDGLIAMMEERNRKKTSASTTAEVVPEE
jgi:phospholipid transport system substrate-binding protein